MDIEENNETGTEATSEPIETSVISIDTEMIIVQPAEVNQANNDNEQQADLDINIPTIEPNNEAEITPNRKKRKRSLSKKSESPKKAPPPLNNDDDDGSTCSICLDTWESKGEHRLVSLKCGHLFGESCIKRWMQECPTQSKCCPTCKSKAAPRDIRNLYAKRIVVADKSEEFRLQELLEIEKTKNVQLQSALSTIKLEMAVIKEEYAKLELEYNQLKKHGVFNDVGQTSSSSHQEIMYKLSMHKNIELNLNGGCRTMTYGRRIQTLVISQKSTVTLFQGHGVRFVNAQTFQPVNFLRISAKPIRHLSLDTDEQLLAAATQDSNAYIHSVTNHTPITTITPAENQTVWTTSFDKHRSRFLYIGSQQGITYVYDVRNCMTPVDQLTTPGEFSPVVGIESVPASSDFRFGGFIVHKLKSLWFYEYTDSNRIEQTRLNVEGTFASVTIDEPTGLLLIVTRVSPKHSQQRMIVARLEKIDQTVVLRTESTIYGSRVTLMARSTQITIGNDSIVANYMQDTKMLSTWNAKNGHRMQGINIEESILDMCPIYLTNGSYLATLSDTRCRIFQLNKV